MARQAVASIGGIAMLFAAAGAVAFTLPETIPKTATTFNFGYRWDATNTTISFDIPAANGNNFNEAFNQAVRRWNAVSGFDLSVVTVSRDPCELDDANGASFRGTLCPASPTSAEIRFGSEVLAITLLLVDENVVRIPPVSGVRGPVFKLLETDIVFNANKTWSVYSGEVQDTEDFRRVAVHELGHVMGIDHVPVDGEPAIMREQIARTEFPQSDDIKGVNARYPTLPNGAAAECSQSTSAATGSSIPGTVLGTCTENDLIGGGSQGPSRRYRLTVGSSDTYTIRSAGQGGYTTKVTLLNSTGNSVIATSNTGASAQLIRSLAAGTYTVVVTGENPGEDGSFTLSALVGSVSSAATTVVPILNLLLEDD